MDGRRFDDLTKALAGGATRRRVLRGALGGAAGAVLALLGRGRGAEAGPPRPAGATCIRNEHCASGVCDPRTRRCTCTPVTACPAGQTCGTAPDGCGQTLTCGPACCQPTTCAAAGKNCGPLDAGCGVQLQCGECTAPLTCGGGVQAGVCGCTPEPDATFCTPGICNRPTNNCGQTVVCGCTDRQTCSDGTCCGAIYQSCDPANDDCCNASVCKAVDGANVCCGVSGVSPCNASTAARCCSGACNLGTCA